MNQALLLAFIAAIMGAANPSYAQTEYQYYAAQDQPLQITSSLDQRYYECLENPDCALKDRFQIMTDINGEMSKTIRGMDRICRETNYKNCVGQQANARRQWYEMYDQMGDMMIQIDPVYQENALNRIINQDARAMSEQEPAAGETYKQKVENRKDWWRDLWNGREEPKAKND